MIQGDSTANKFTTHGIRAPNLWVGEKTLTGASADELVCCGPGGGGTLMFSSLVGSGPASTVHPQKNIWNFKHPKKTFEILATPKNIPYSVP